MTQIWSRNTCPTYRGLRLSSFADKADDLCRKTCPTNRGLRRTQFVMLQTYICRKTCPTYRGLKPDWINFFTGSRCRKTCPTHWGLRLDFKKRSVFAVLLKDFPHTSGVSSFSDDLKPRSSENVGRPAPLIGDKNQTALMVLFHQGCFCVGRMFKRLG